jgi:hypothetical protein
MGLASVNWVPEERSRSQGARCAHAPLGRRLPPHRACDAYGRRRQRGLDEKRDGFDAVVNRHEAAGVHPHRARRRMRDQGRPDRGG